MTIKATSNQTGLTRTLSRVSVLWEIAPGDDEGGKGFPWLPGNVRTLRKADNDANLVFTKGNEHLPDGTPQANALP